MGRNKIIYGLSRLAFVVATDEGSGGTWTGANEALDRGFAPVAVWAGAGAKDGNQALIRRGATAVDELHELFTVRPDTRPPDPVQASLFN
jgi:predicted Rossmann fold nucleotide-binding protein DprA/Smf involved in DNA uptake